jgi:NADPH:quinone reductase-like Zn-dependent oxidoreductase
MLARGGALISYGTASTRDVAGNPRVPVLKLLARLLTWNVLSNGRRAKFFNLWAGARKRDRYRADLRRDLDEVLRLLLQGAIDAQIAKRFALRDAGAALRYAEQGALVGKVVLEP